MEIYDYYSREFGGEKSISKAKKLPDDYLILNDVTVKVNDKEVQIDHILVSPYGVWCVETKSHLGRIYGKEQDKNWTQKKKSDGGKIYTKSFYNPVTQNAVHSRRVEDFLKQKIGLNVPVKSVIVFTSADQLNVHTTTPVVTPKKLISTILEIDRVKALTEEQIKWIT
ncbi:nuclease-related domain-containing protein [Tepidibacillus marianensis]|uniref:nuclease-related domain-containing protein n=1 Tax=Tepidibacillus marianensis TaxID=3131995 RepID=UPI0030CC29BC